MPYPRPEPDPAPSLATSAASASVQAESPQFITDFADLAARFSAQTGGGLPTELAAELALEIVLNEIVMQACLATGATGAAIVLKRDEEMVCRATSGVTAPDLGSVLETSSGILGECLRSRRAERADDTLTDTRADAAASLRLGVRSVMVMPLVRGEELVGAFELFSSSAFAFGDRDERTLEALAGRTLNSLERAAQPLQELPIVSHSAETVAKAAENNAVETATAAQGEESVSRSRLDYVTLVLAAAVVAGAVLLGMLLGRHFELQKKAKAREHSGATTSTIVNASAAAKAPTDVNPSATAASSGGTALTAAPSKSPASKPIPPGSLQVFQNGKEIFRLSPGASDANQQIGVQQAASIESLQKPASQGLPVLELSPAEVESSLLYRVEPHYPETARQQRIAGMVVLEVHINADGSVEAAHIVSGPPQLLQAATDAVRQWRFRPRTENGVPVRMHALVTLNFQVPQ